ncbi:hypothetical protein AWV79_26765 [Cupriavidus sp. UYMMa02A]|nr:hypothetical protein AWV79_26765 [Cupriavidus sp. UYMMa02A]
MVRGELNEQCAVIASAIERGVNIFDTSPTYGGGHSETNLGKVLRIIGATPLVGTKIDLGLGDFDNLDRAIKQSVQRSQERLNRDRLDILYLHSRVGRQRDLPGRVLSVDDVIGHGGVADVMKELQRKGVVGAIGFTGLGHTESVIEVLESDRFDLFQMYYNLLNPSAVEPTVAAWRAQDYGGMARWPPKGTSALSVFGPWLRALSAMTEDFTASRKRIPRWRARRGRCRSSEGAVFRQYAQQGESMAAFALRFALSAQSIDTVLVGISERSHLDEAIAAAKAGPLEQNLLQALAERFRELYEMA